MNKYLASFFASHTSLPVSNETGKIEAKSSPVLLQQGTDFEYRREPRVSNSFMSRIGTLIKHGEKKELGFTQSAVFAFGDAVHKAVLEPQNFKQEDYKDFGLDWKTFDGMVKGCNENARLQEYLAYSFKEVIHFFDMQELPCKGKIDLVHLGHSLIVDLKTTSATTYEDFAKTVKTYQYDRQMAFYCDACGAKKAIVVGISKKNFELFFYEMTHEDFEKGRYKYTECLKRIKEYDLLRFAS
jgi:hypothetical protein